MDKKQSFWNTLPGILTGVAGLITAIAGLLVVLNQVGVLESEPPERAVTTTNSEGKKQQTNAALQSPKGKDFAVNIPPAPFPRKPECGSVIAWPEHGLILNWKRVTGASTYTVEVDCFGCGEPRTWFSLSGTPWHIRPGLGLRSPIYSSDINKKLREAGGLAMRWRVWAVDSNGVDGDRSRWCQLAFAGG